VQISMLTGLAVPAADSTLRVTDSAWLVPRMGHEHGDFLFPTETPPERVSRVLCGIHLNYVAVVIVCFIHFVFFTKWMNSLLGTLGLSWV
jgi:hypothetical protein